LVTNRDAYAAAVASKRQWLVLVYKVPSEPTRLRATVWRRLKSLGAVYLQNSVAALPVSASGERAMRGLRNEIVEMGGAAQLLRADALAGEADVVAAFNAARDEEYAEIVDRCADFLDEIKRETKAKKFTYAELEENEVDLVKLRDWLSTVGTRDTLGAPGAAAAVAGVGRCEKAFEDFTTRVYAANADH